MSFLIILLVIGGGGSLAVTAVYYNQLTRSRIKVREALSGIDVQLKRRHDLIPNLVAIVRSHGNYDISLTRPLEVHAGGRPGMTVRETAQKEEAVGRALRTAIDAAHSIPDLNGNKSFLDLQQNLMLIEKDLEMARRYYNALVRDHNSACETFPSGLIAKILGIKQEFFFEATDSEAARPEITPG